MSRLICHPLYRIKIMPLEYLLKKDIRMLDTFFIMNDEPGVSKSINFMLFLFDTFGVLKITLIFFHKKKIN